MTERAKLENDGCKASMFEERSRTACLQFASDEAVAFVILKPERPSAHEARCELFGSFCRNKKDMKISLELQSVG